MSKKGHQTEGNKPRKKSKAAAYFVRGLAAVLGLAVGFCLYWVYLFGGTFVSVPVVNEEDYSTLDLSEGGSTTGGDVTSSWSNGGHTRLYYDPSHPIIEVKQKDPNIENILVFGIDARGTDDYACRTDCMMILSINKKNDTLKIISLMRDTAVYIGDTEDTLGTRLNKLNSAYHFGGVGEMINTINVMFDFGSASDMIDLVGGVEIEVKPEEVTYLNGYLDEINALDGDNSPHLTQGGTQILDGHQAVAWSRIRYLDSDFVRASRQRTVATAMMTKVNGMSYGQKLQLLNDSAGVFETNMNTADIMRVALNCFACLDNREEYRFPEDGTYTIQNDPWMMLVDFDEQKQRINDYIWGE